MVLGIINQHTTVIHYSFPLFSLVHFFFIAGYFNTHSVVGKICLGFAPMNSPTHKTHNCRERSSVCLLLYISADSSGHRRNDRVNGQHGI